MTTLTIAYISLSVFACLGLFLGLRKKAKQSGPSVPAPVAVPPIRKTWVDQQIETLVAKVLQSIQQQPMKWRNWGHYKEGFGQEVTDFELHGEHMGVVISPCGKLRYHSYRKNDDDNKEACWFELPLEEYDTQQIREAFVWLAAAKSIDLLNKKNPSEEV